MLQSKLLKLFLEKKESLQPSFDFIIDTWQVSYVRFAGGKKATYSSIEEFYHSLILSNKNQSSSHYTQAEWIDRVNWQVWCEGLTISKSSEDELKEEIKYSLEEIEKEFEENNNQEKIPEIPFPINTISSWSIKETKNQRHAVGLTWAILSETSTDYFYIERHWES